MDPGSASPSGVTKVKVESPAHPGESQDPARAGRRATKSVTLAKTMGPGFRRGERFERFSRF